MTNLGPDDPDKPPIQWPAHPRPTILQKREELVQAGDVAGLYGAILSQGWHEVNLGDAFAQLLRALDIASRKNPAVFTDDLFRMMINAAGFAALRVQYALFQRISELDRNTHGRSPDLPADVLSELTGRLQEMQSHVAELCQTRAATARLWQLALEKKLANERRSSKQRKRRQQTETAASKVNGSPNGRHARVEGNGHDPNRLAALLVARGKQGEEPP